MLNLPPIDSPAANAYWLAPGNIPFSPDPEVQADAQKLVPVGMPPAPDASENARLGALQGVQQGQRSWLDGQVARANNFAYNQQNKELEVGEGSHDPF